jgi:ParB/RepB/Spo0J family partition protein
MEKTMTNLSNAVTKTMNFVFADIEESSNNKTQDKAKKIATLKANIGKMVTISLGDIETNENIRKSIDTNSESFLRLVESVKKYGILENIVAELRLSKNENDYKLVCIAGHRRILAAKAAKNIAKIPCLLQSYTTKGDNIGVALAENLNREDLHCFDVADGYKELIASGWSEDDLAQHFCRDIRTIRHYLKISQWSDDIKKTMREKADIFSTRVIMREFAYKKLNTTSDIKNAIKNYLAPKTKKISTPALKNSSGHEKKACRQALNSYLAKQTKLSSLIKDEIKRAFTELELI